jgi:hypothetical protein
MRSDRVLAHEPPWTVKDATVVLTGPSRRKRDALPMLTRNARSRLGQHPLGDRNHV